MTLTASRHRKRRIAFTMLLVWMFALLSGVVNACLTEPRGEPAPGGPHASQAEYAAKVAVRPHAVGQARQNEHPDKAPCLKACDESSRTLLKQLPKPDTPDLQAVAFPIYAQATLRVAPAALVRAVLAAAPRPSPPPRVQFSRLAL
ncbi:MAG: hypothetical protein HZC37_01610 [Burkholderiales bacterium]|nr:hypothetical protein [Burkholderiales bacterium]